MNSKGCPSFSRASKARIERKKGAMRRTTVYLEIDTATRLASFCKKNDEEMSATVDAAVRGYLRRRGF